jgi:hypothetical protein
MSSDCEGKRQEGSAVPGQPPNENRLDMVRVVLDARRGAGMPFEGTVEVGSGGLRSFHGWLELMGLVEEGRASAEP